MPQERPKQLDSPLLPKIFKYAGRAHVWVYRRTGGRIGGKWRIGAGFRKPVPTLLLEHRGRKSGKLFVSPLLYMLDRAARPGWLLRRGHGRSLWPAGERAAWWAGRSVSASPVNGQVIPRCASLYQEQS
jgi:hypothetical protein